MKSLGIIVNPFSGRDVRRVAARASTSDHHEKQQQVTRLVLGAFATGVEKIFLAHEPFRINEKAVENLPVRDRVEILRFKLTHTAADTSTMARMMWDRGCRVFIVLGGDGTSRIVAREFVEATVLPLSTGTNNVFPHRVEASVAGMAAGLIAAGKVSEEHCLPCKRVHIQKDQEHDIALVDVVLLRDDFLGNLMPFEAEKLRELVLARAEPASIGISPIGGYFEPTAHADDNGVFVQCDPDGSTGINVPISPGLHADVGIKVVRRIELGEVMHISGPGVLAFDGDRTIKLNHEEIAKVQVLRDGPRIIEADRIMAIAAETSQFAHKIRTT